MKYDVSRVPYDQLLPTKILRLVKKATKSTFITTSRALTHKIPEV